MHFELGFGKVGTSIDVPDTNIIDVLYPNDVKVSLTGADEVKRALENPIGCGRLSTIVKPGEKIAIVTSDITRPMPSYKVMPALLEELFSAGVSKDDVTIVLALGSHRAHTEEEKRKIVGEEAYSTVRCVDSDPSDCRHLGTTKAGTPVDVFSVVANADRRILLGNIEYHYFAGYSGGAKAIMPGVSTRAAIQQNHSQMVSDAAAAGRLSGNPVREDIDSIADFISIDFILNVVLDAHKEIICAVAGDYIKAHRAGCAFLDSLYLKKIPKKADIVIVSPGGFPKDINLYQAQKALDNAKHAMRDGGVIILIGSCAEGLGERTFEEWMTKSPSPDFMVERIARDFQLGGHKAAAIAMILQRGDVYLVSDLPDDFVRGIFLTPFSSPDKALSAAFEKMGKDASVLVMPYGGSTLPQL